MQLFFSSISSGPFSPLANLYPDLQNKETTKKGQIVFNNSFVQTYVFHDNYTTATSPGLAGSKEKITDFPSNSPTLQILTTLCPKSANFSLEPKLTESPKSFPSELFSRQISLVLCIYKRTYSCKYKT